MQIHTLSARALLDALSAGALSSVEIVRALLARHEAVDEQTAAFVHVFHEEALSEAEALDQERAAGRLRGPLHGLPITVKENLATAGLPVTMGIKARLDAPAPEDAVVVKVARAAGAIVLGKTNIPLALLAMESENEIWGMTRNPWDLGRSPGGSSGGEGAAIATGQSPLGLGTDIGGSIRIPAAWCGIAGLKPTFGRWSTVGQHGGIPGQEAIRAPIGPLARTVGDLVLAMRAISPERQRPLDARVPPIPFADPEGIDLAGLRVGVFEDDGFFPPSAPMRRAVREAADALRAAGATVVPYEVGRTRELVETYFSAMSADGGKTLKRALAGQGPSPQLETLLALVRMPALGRKAVARLMAARGEARVSLLLDVFGEKTVAEFWALCAKRGALQAAELAAWRQQGLDLVLCPPTVTPPALLRETADWSLGAWHTMRWNLLDLPAGVVPVTTVAAHEQSYEGASDRLERKADRFMGGSAGLPVAAQVVGRPWEEDRVLAAMAAVEAVVAPRPDFPRTPIDPRARS